MKRLLLAAALCCASVAHAGLISGFNGPFDVLNWTSSAGDGSIATTAAQDAVSLTSGDNGSGDLSFTSFYIRFSGDVTVNFSWDYLSSDADPLYDSFGYVLANDEGSLPAGFALLSVGGDLAQSGSSSVVVSAGQYFGFAILSDNLGGPATATVNGLRFDVPEPGSLALLAVALAAAAATTTRRRRAA